MTDVLVVDGEKNYCEQLAFALSGRGFSVETATSGREAIDLGAWFRPDVLVADWSPSKIHGLKVAETLRLVKQDMSLVLMTGFSSTHLELEAWRLGAFALLEKPFATEQMLSTIESAAAQPRSTRPSPVAVVGTSPNGEIVFANPKAQELLAATRAGSGAARIQEILDRNARRKLRAATSEWQEVEALADRPVAWQVRARSTPDLPGRLMVLLEGEQFLTQPDPERRYYGNEILVRLLLDTPPENGPRWPFGLDNVTLVVDSSDMFRHLAIAEIERTEAIWLPASNAEDARRILQRHPRIGVIVLDEEVLAESADLIDELRDLRPEAVIVGQSLGEDRYPFASHRVDRFLRKPWEIEDLIRVLKAKKSVGEVRSYRGRDAEDPGA